VSHQTVSQVLLGLAFSLLMIVRHRTNIERLLRGKESRFDSRRMRS
jgi:glycerol-3-phosphate acyltransferase PlsY